MDADVVDENHVLALLKDIETAHDGCEAQQHAVALRELLEEELIHRGAAALEKPTRDARIGMTGGFLTANSRLVHMLREGKRKRLNALLAMEELLNLRREFYGDVLLRTHNAALLLLRKNQPFDYETSIAASSLLGKVLKKASNWGLPWAKIVISTRTKDCIETLHEDRGVSELSSLNRVTAVLLLHQLAKSAPSSVAERRRDVCELIWRAICDREERVRICSVDALRRFVEVLTAGYGESGKQVARLLCNSLYGNLREYVPLNTSASAGAIHGCILALDVMLENTLTRNEIFARFDVLLKVAKDCIHHPRLMVRESIFRFVPRLLETSPGEFKASGFFDTLISSLFKTLHNVKAAGIERHLAFQILGLVAKAVGGERFKPHTKRTLNFITEVLSGDAYQRNIQMQTDALCCLGMLAESMETPNHAFIRQVHNDLFGHIKSIPLSEDLASALVSIAKAVPSLHAHIQALVLERAAAQLKPLHFQSWQRHAEWKQSRYSTNTLTSAPSTPPLGVSPTSSTKSESPIMSEGSLFRGTIYDYEEGVSLAAQDSDPILQTLKIVTMFDFTGIEPPLLIAFNNACVTGYFESIKERIRTRAVEVCTHLAAACITPEDLHADAELREDLSVILMQVACIGVSDPDHRVRSAALRALDNPRFDAYLGQEQISRTLYLCLYDERFSVKKIGVALTTRICHRSPSFSSPIIFTFIKNIVASLQYRGEIVREAADLLPVLVKFVPALTVPYFRSIMKFLVKRLEECAFINDTGSAEPLLRTVAELVSCPGGDQPNFGSVFKLDRYKRQLFDFIISALDMEHGDSGFKWVALRTLARVIQNTKSPVTPYHEYPKLIRIIARILRMEVDQDVRIEAQTLLGVLGAIDPNDVERNVSLAPLSENLGLTSSSSVHFVHNPLLRPAPTFAGSEYHMQYGISVSGPPQRWKWGISEIEEMEAHRNAEAAEDSPIFEGSRKLGRLKHPPGGGEKSLHDTSEEFSGKFEGDKVEVYIPDWVKEPLVTKSLVGQLTHPFTASPIYFTAAVTDVLNGMLIDRKMKIHFREVVNALRIVCETALPPSYAKRKPFYSVIVPRLLWLLRPGQIDIGDAVKASILNSIGRILVNAGRCALEFSRDVFFVLEQFVCGSNVELAKAALAVMSNLKEAIDGADRPFGGQMVSLVLSRLFGVSLPPADMVEPLIQCLSSLGFLVENDTFLAMTAMMRAAENHRLSARTRIHALKALRQLSEGLPHSGMSARLILPLTRILGRNRNIKDGVDSEKDSSLKEEAVLLLVELADQVPNEFLVFVSTIAKALKESRMTWSSARLLQLKLLRADEAAAMSIFGIYRKDVKRLLKWLDDAMKQATSVKLANARKRFNTRAVKRGFAVLGSNGATVTSDEEGKLCEIVQIPRSLDPNRQILRRASEINSLTSQDDWKQWLIKFSANLLSQSSSPALRACAPLCDGFPRLGRDLFNASFLSCFSTNFDEFRSNELAMTIRRALESPSIPVDVAQTLLGLAEFMQHDEKPLPIHWALLARVAIKCGALAKALYYKEREFKKHYHAATDRDGGLVSIYEALGHMDSAVGTIMAYERKHSIENKEVWFEKLRMWDEAIAAYDEQEQAPSQMPKFERLLGRMRCYDQLGEWHRLDAIAQDAWEKNKGNIASLKKIADEGRGASVAFDLGRYESFRGRLEVTDPRSYTGGYYRALMAVKEDRLEEAEKWLLISRKALDPVLTASIGESYPRAYREVMNSQQLVEIGEMIAYKRNPSENAKRHLGNVWNRRLVGCTFDRLVWYRSLMVRSLVLSVPENYPWWLRFCSLCRKSGRLPMALEAFCKLLNPDLPFETTFESEEGMCLYEDRLAELARTHLKFDVPLAFAKYLWARGRHKPAFKLLKEKANELRKPTRGGAFLRSEAKVFAKLASWVRHLRDSLGANKGQMGTELDYALKATEYDPSWHYAWHSWGLLHAERASEIISRDNPNYNSADSADGRKTLSLPPKTYTQQFVISVKARNSIKCAIQGLHKAVERDGRTRMQDQLKILQLWHHYGSVEELRKVFIMVADECNADLWTDVIPQILTPLYSRNYLVQQGIKRLLLRIAERHPQMTCYPLIVAVNSSHKERTETARAVLDEIRKMHELVVTTTEKFAKELVRVTILWNEMWLDGLENAARKYKETMDPEKFCEVVDRVHVITRGLAETKNESEFQGKFEAKFVDARRAVRESDIRVAWNRYGQIREALHKDINNQKKLMMNEVSTFLDNARNLPIAIPGTYRPHYKEKIFVSSVEREMIILQSKERPRKLFLRGSNGCMYGFLLKGHEDLRQDERIMQMHGLINSLLRNSEDTNLRAVKIRRYLVVALSPEAGLIELVPNMDTLHAVVKQYRESRHLLLNLEPRLMMRQVPNYDVLPLLQKVNIFENMLQETMGNDMACILWMRSRSSELWLERRTTYAQSLAVTNIAGYLLGIGDRHPSNIMLDRESAELMHIDFGDIFEIAQQRPDHPERVPFRLTRLLVGGLEPCGVDGIYHRTSVRFVELIRKDKDSLMAILDAFVYDPIIRNRLLTSIEDKKFPEHDEETDRLRHTPAAVEEGAVRLENAVSGDNDSDRSSQEDANAVLVNGSNHSGSSKQKQLVARENNNTKHKRRNLIKQSARKDEQATTTDPPSGASDEMEHIADDDSSTKVSVIDGEVVRDRESALNKRALKAIDRVKDKLYGREFGCGVVSPEDQVVRIVADATSVENLCQHFVGWCPFW